MKKISILGIDLQNDFVLLNGSLSVVGALDDMKRIADFINRHSHKIHSVNLTLDSHHPIHIASPCFWRDKSGQHPQHFTQITSADAMAGLWIPQYNPNWAYKYLEELEKGGVNCVIWPPHCILGTNGWALTDDVMDAVKKWEIDNAKPYNLWFKGSNWYTEHYSIFKSNVPYPNAPETSLNQNLLQILNSHDIVFLFGEAADFCVVNSLKDILDESPKLASKIVVLEDCMSWIQYQNPYAVAIYERAKQMGVTFAKSVDITL